MNIKNTKLLTRVLEVSLLTGLVLTTFTGSTVQAQNPIILELKDDKEDDYFCTYEDIKNYRYYFICINDPEYEEKVYMTKIPSYSFLEQMENNRMRYYYSDVFSGDFMGSAICDRMMDTLTQVQGPSIYYAIKLEDYIKYYGIEKEGYTKEQLEQIYNHAKEEFAETDFKNFEQEKVLIKDNYL